MEPGPSRRPSAEAESLQFLAKEHSVFWSESKRLLEKSNLTVEAKPKVLHQEQVGTDVRGSLGDRCKMNRTHGDGC